MPFRNSTFTLYCSNPQPGVEPPAAPYNERTLPGFTMVSITPGRMVLSCPLHAMSGPMPVGMRARVVQFPYGAADGTQLFTGRIVSIENDSELGQQRLVVEQAQDPRVRPCVVCGQRGCRHTHDENWLQRARAEPQQHIPEYVPPPRGSRIAPLLPIAGRGIMMDDLMPKPDRETLVRSWDRELNDPKREPRTAWERLLEQDPDALP